METDPKQNSTFVIILKNNNNKKTASDVTLVSKTFKPEDYFRKK